MRRCHFLGPRLLFFPAPAARPFVVLPLLSLCPRTSRLRTGFLPGPRAGSADGHLPGHRIKRRFNRSAGAGAAPGAAPLLCWCLSRRRGDAGGRRGREARARPPGGGASARARGAWISPPPPPSFVLLLRPELTASPGPSPPAPCCPGALDGLAPTRPRLLLAPRSRFASLTAYWRGAWQKRRKSRERERGGKKKHKFDAPASALQSS